MNNWIDNSMKICTQEATLSDRKVIYECAEISELMDFSQNVYKSSGVDKTLLEQFIRDGAHPLDILRATQVDDDSESKETEQ
jgi:hypothetical protein